jgi:ficolin
MLHYLTTQYNYTLRLDMEDWKGTKKVVTYDTFIVKSEEDGYELTVSGFKGDAGDSLSTHSGKKFSTYDVDNDDAPLQFWNGNCAKRFHGAWWYKACYRSNLNGKYYKDGGQVEKKRNDGVSWNSWTGNKYSLKSVEMKIRKNFKK